MFWVTSQGLQPSHQQEAYRIAARLLGDSSSSQTRSGVLPQVFGTTRSTVLPQSCMTFQILQSLITVSPQVWDDQVLTLSTVLQQILGDFPSFTTPQYCFTAKNLLIKFYNPSLLFQQILGDL